MQAFQKDAPTISKDAKANYGKYATLGAIIEAIRKPLAEQGLSFSQLPGRDGLTTIIMHTSGEYLMDTAPLQMEKQTAQGQGSAITYMRRYALGAALGLVTDDDDDGAAASKPAQPARKATPAASSPAPAAAKKAAAKPALTKEQRAELETKQKIAALMKELVGKELKGEELIEAITKRTSLDVVPEKFADIIARLETLIEESKQQ